MSSRFDSECNMVYQMPEIDFDKAKDNPNSLFTLAFPYMQHHHDRQVPRLQVLQQYYIAHNDIKHKAKSKSPNHSNNRIASAFAQYITNIRVGYFLGNDIQFKVDSGQADIDTSIFQDKVDNFNHRNDEVYIDEVIKKDLSITGRAYDLVYAEKGTNNLGLTRLDPATCFVIYNDEIKPQPLMAVRYYETGILNQNIKENYEIYTADNVFYYHTQGGFINANIPIVNAVFDNSIPLYFGRVPVDEFANNDERTGDWEAELDDIDALDKSVSMMADFQEDFDNANIILTGKFANMSEPAYMKDDKGNIIKGKDGNPIVLEPAHPEISPHNHMWYLEPYAMSQGVGMSKTIIQPTAQYLTKQYDFQGWQTYTDFLIGEIHKYTNTPNVSDQNFASNASGVAMSYKLWGSDQERKIQEALFQKGLNQRYMCCINYWKYLNGLPNMANMDTSDIAGMLNYIFTPNLPKNDQEQSTLIQQLNSTGLFSQQTLRELGQSITGVSADTEDERVNEDEETENQKQNGYLQNGVGNIFATGKPIEPQNNESGNE